MKLAPRSLFLAVLMGLIFAPALSFADYMPAERQLERLENIVTLTSDQKAQALQIYQNLKDVMDDMSPKPEGRDRCDPLNFDARTAGDLRPNSAALGRKRCAGRSGHAGADSKNPKFCHQHRADLADRCRASWDGPEGSIGHKFNGLERRSDDDGRSRFAPRKRKQPG